MPTPLKISTDADYLKAHITLIHSQYRVNSVALYNAKQRFLAEVKKWLPAAREGKT